MNIMLMSVRERTHEIGLRKSVGATRRDIRRQFLAEAVMLATLGGASGAIGGGVFSRAVPAASPPPGRRPAGWGGVGLGVCGAGRGVFWGDSPAPWAPPD